MFEYVEGAEKVLGDVKQRNEVEDFYVVFWDF